MSTHVKKEYDRFSISLPVDLKEQFEKLCDRLKMSRSDAIRKSMRLFINDESQSAPELYQGNILGTITYLESAHVHGHPDGDEEKPHTHGGITHIHSQPDLPLKTSDSHYFSVEQLEFIEINELQHHYLDIIISTTHIHTGPDKCMLVIAVKGSATRVQNLYDTLKRFRTIDNIQLAVVEKY
jgi:metal-responsive CopG/Arc/MetJ family transcriptional regulator